MNLMLAMLFACLGLGLAFRHWERRIYVLVAGLATAMTMLYYFTQRFM